MMKNNRIIKNFIVLAAILIISFFIEILIFHFPLLFDKNIKNEISNISYSYKENKNNKIITTSLDHKYVNKFRIKYETDKDIKYTIKYIEDDYYKNNKETTIKDVFDEEVNEVVLNFNNKVKKIKILYNTNSDIKIKSMYIDNKFYINYFRIIYMFILQLILYIIYSFYKKGFKNEEIHKCFFIVCLLIGTLIIIIQPSASFFSWDDQVHFKNVNELSSGNAIWNIGEYSMIYDAAVGRNSINSLEEQENQKKYLNQVIEGNYASYGGRFITYNKISYIPLAIGFRFSRFIGIPFSIAFKIGKWFNLLIYLLIVSYAIKIARFNKKLVTVIGMLPTSIFLSSQYSYDAAVTSGLLLSIVIIMNWFVDKSYKVNFKTFTIFLSAILYGCFPKAIYIPFILLFLFIPKNRFNNRKQLLSTKIGVVLIFIMMMSTFVLPTVTVSNEEGDSRGGNTSVSEQLKLIINHPVGYVKVIEDTMISRFTTNLFGKKILFNYSYISDNYYKNYNNNNISESDTSVLGDNLYYIYLFILIFVIITENNEKYKISKLNRIIGIVSIIAVILLIWTAMYLAFTPIGLNTINGVQPRYFIPLLLPLAIFIKSNKIKNSIPDNIYNLIVILIPSLVLTISIYQYILVYYCM